MEWNNVVVTECRGNGMEMKVGKGRGERERERELIREGKVREQRKRRTPQGRGT